MNLLKATGLSAIMMGAMLTMSARAGIIYNPTTDFSLTQNHNVNGVWSYGHADASFTPGSFTLLNYLENNPAAPGSPVVGWRLEPNDSANIWVNSDSAIHFGVPPGDLSLHPNYDFTPTVLRWTAPSDGSVIIGGQFLTGDSGTPDVTLRLNLNGTVLWTANNAGGFNFSENLKKGDTVDYAVYNAFGSGNTPLETTIDFTAVPEASTVFAGALLLLPFGASALRIMRKNQAA